MADLSSDHELRETPLAEIHRGLGARMVPFAGYSMPVQYAGIIAEHNHTREQASLFDVSHMGLALLSLRQPSGDPEADHAAIAALVEPLVPGDIAGLKPGQIRYTLLLNQAGGIRDDLMIARPLAPADSGTLYIVVNAGTKGADFALIAAQAGAAAELRRLDDGALLALQGPAAVAVMDDFLPGATGLAFMTHDVFTWQGVELIVARAGYTGEDGFEIRSPREAAVALWQRLAGDERVRPAGLGARDSLRLEAGLPLYGHDLDEATTPIEAGLAFAIAKRRREAGDFPGAARILEELRDGPKRLRVGLAVDGKAPAREGAAINDAAGRVIGAVTSGGYGPTVGGPIAMGYVEAAASAPGTAVTLSVRGRALEARIAPLPFVPHRYVRKPSPTR